MKPILLSSSVPVHLDLSAGRIHWKAVQWYNASKQEELCPSLISEARDISLKFKSLFQLFATCQFISDSKDQVDDEENIDKLG